MFERRTTNDDDDDDDDVVTVTVTVTVEKARLYLAYARHMGLARAGFQMAVLLLSLSIEI